MATPSASSYNADAIEVLSGLDPVRKRPGMYTDTSRPNHLAQEVIDNSVDKPWPGTPSRCKSSFTPTIPWKCPTMVVACRWTFTPKRVCRASS